ncbi:unnamed protein product [Rhizoctonia solani]|uniref:Uncharacterized protein n=1 Tax=Rhizoctonia solani TaxID=456999 RepID=A0A8H3DXM1_9AGAM|nr:unnamed protein product [Rhizoctonia solani]
MTQKKRLRKGKAPATTKQSRPRNPSRKSKRSRTSNMAGHVVRAEMSQTSTPTPLYLTKVPTMNEPAPFLKGFLLEELGDEPLYWREEAENGFPQDLPAGQSLVRVMNTFSFLNADGMRCYPDAFDFENCQEEVQMVGWVCCLTVGPKRFFRVVSGHWPPPEWDVDGDNEANVWRVSMAVMRVRIREIYWGSTQIYGHTIEGLFARAWNNRIEYWLQHAGPEYEEYFQNLCVKHGFPKRCFQDLDVSQPNDGKMHPWTLEMMRLEKDYLPIHPEDRPFEYADYCNAEEGYMTDASSIASDDDAEFPTGRNWRAYKYRSNQVDTTTANTPDKKGKEKQQEDSISRTQESDVESAPPAKRQRLSSSQSAPELVPASNPDPVSEVHSGPKLQPTATKPGSSSPTPSAAHAIIPTPAPSATLASTPTLTSTLGPSSQDASTNPVPRRLPRRLQANLRSR